MTAATAARVLIFFAAALWLPGATASAQAAVDTTRNTQTFLSAVADYRAGAYERAARGFASIADSGVVNAALFYNLANSYLKSGDLGRAILWYERALELSPRDPDLKFNHAAAKKFTRRFFQAKRVKNTFLIR